MWLTQSVKIKQHKTRVNYIINRHAIERFKVVTINIRERCII